MTRAMAHAVVPAPVRRLGRAERRASILSGAASAFVVGGYAATSMAEISQAAGVSHLIIYRHFDSKDDLYRTVLERARDNLRSALSADGALGMFGPTPAALITAARGDTDSFRVLWRHAAREPEFAHYADEEREFLANATRAALEPSVAPEYLGWATRATLSHVLEAVVVWIEDGDSRLDDRFVAATEAALRAGVRSWAKSAGPARLGRGGEGA